jgi:hypothetical protein
MSVWLFSAVDPLQSFNVGCQRRMSALLSVFCVFLLDGCVSLFCLPSFVPSYVSFLNPFSIFEVFRIVLFFTFEFGIWVSTVKLRGRVKLSSFRSQLRPQHAAPKTCILRLVLWRAHQLDSTFPPLSQIFLLDLFPIFIFPCVSYAVCYLFFPFMK